MRKKRKKKGKTNNTWNGEKEEEVSRPLGPISVIEKRGRNSFIFLRTQMTFLGLCFSMTFSRLLTRIILWLFVTGNHNKRNRHIKSLFFFTSPKTIILKKSL